jgi:hypothetical protein
MRNFLLGTLFGIVVATVGLGGIAIMADNVIAKVKTFVQEQANQ